MTKRYMHDPAMHIYIPGDHSTGEKQHTCWLCGGPKYLRWELKFKLCSAEPQVDEVFTGATNEQTGVVVEVELLTGAYARSDAKGFIELSDVTGESENEVFEDGEIINGSDGGNNILTVDGYCTRKAYGLMYPLSHLTKWRGRWYCDAHLEYKMKPDLRKEERIPTNLEKDRGKLP